ncbi:calphotin isoform X1 [Parasteatoda tepidariorum]|uniref:calphotin isoform X1 n=1 Tax=Parasteatoda tepidariorum TaxID=114398 RepID=UPI001C725A1B|nr:calphotin-like isoform X2 [Parasteatoda tepidariorum]
MKVLILLAVVAVVRCTVIPVAVGETGASAQFRSEDNLGNYNFGYNEDHTSGGTFRREAGDAHGNVAGSYGLRDADGRIRIVNYIANDDGFKADIKTNEPGVEPKDTADATFNKAESVVVHSAVAIPAPAPVVAIPAAEPIAFRTEQVAVAAPVFPPVAAVPVAKTIAAPLTKSSTTTITTEARPLFNTFPAAAAVPVAKTHTTTVTETKPAAYAFPAPAAVPVAKTIAAPVAFAEPAPLAYAFPAPAAVPVAKSSTTTFTTAEAKPVFTAFPAPAAVPVAKTHTTITETRPATYAFPAPAAVPVAKSIAAPIAVAAAAPLPYAFPAPAAVPVAKSSTLTYAAAPIAAAPLAYAAPTSKFSYSSHVINAAPALAPSAIAYAPKYALSPYISTVQRPLFSPAIASFAGPVPYFSNIEYHGYPVVKK